MGSDSFCNLKKWKNYQSILDKYSIIVFKRSGFEPDGSLTQNIEICKAPLLEISSTYIRSLIQEKKSIRYLVQDDVMHEILQNGYYRKVTIKVKS